MKEMMEMQHYIQLIKRGINFLLIIIVLGVNLNAETVLKKKQKIIYKAIEKLKNDRQAMEDFYFIGKSQCLLFAEVGDPKYIRRSLVMLLDTNKLPFYIMDDRKIEKYFQNFFAKKTLLNERKRIAPNQVIYTNPRRSEQWTAYYVCDTLNRITKINIKKYKNYLEQYKKEVEINDFFYEISLAYLNKKVLALKKKSQNNFINDINQANLMDDTILNETKIVISQTSGKEYTAEASAMRASIWLANLNYNVPNKYIDDVGRVGKMKNKPIIATAKKFKTFMDNEFSYQTINIELNATSNITFLKNKFANKKGLYIFIPSNSEQFGLTGYVTIWDGNISNNRKYIFQRKGKATLYIFDDKQTQKNHTKPK